jgi:hypothetical protein
MATYDNLFVGLTMADVPYGLCSICDGEHAWQNVKCDLLWTPEEEN